MKIELPFWWLWPSFSTVALPATGPAAAELTAAMRCRFEPSQRLIATIVRLGFVPRPLVRLLLCNSCEVKNGFAGMRLAGAKNLMEARVC
jgi:hypothetical protein